MTRLYLGKNISKSNQNNKIKLDTVNQWSNLSSKYSFQNVIEATGNPVAFKHTISLAMHGGNILWQSIVTKNFGFYSVLWHMRNRGQLEAAGDIY